MSLEKATLGGGCFWCIESVFKRVDGVKSVVSGYAGGESSNPTYEEICTGKTGHAEVVQVEYDTGTISFRELLNIFFTIHDPTTLNRQGNDVGTQYRSIILCSDQNQLAEARDFVSEIEAEARWPDPVVTEIRELDKFYDAELYHQDFFEKNPGNPYCNYFIPPKLEKLKNKYRKFYRD